MISNKYINDLASSLSDKFDLKKIILFGSYAHGNPDENSDLDLCIVTDLKGKRKIDIMRELRKELYMKLNTPLDILVYEEHEFDQRSKLQNTLEYKILKFGRLLNG
jgi:predicted nucleotidyltransferase